MPPPSAPTRTPGTWDVIVVGAGPAGATAARVAAEKGCATLLLERVAIPRYKTCGGGLIEASLAALPPAWPRPWYAAPPSWPPGSPGTARVLLCERPPCPVAAPLRQPDGW